MSNLRKPVYLLAGGKRGAKRPDPILETVFRESGKLAPSVAYIGAATGDDRNFFRFIASGFKAAGAGEVKLVPLAGKTCSSAEAKKILQNADVVFLSGGDVEAGMNVINHHHLQDYLFGLYQEGKLFFGLSAGSIMLGLEWIRWRNPEDDTSAELFPCLGIASVICDTHAEEDNWMEIKALLRLKAEGARGYGIPTGTALKVAPDGQLTALGGAIPCFIRKGSLVEYEGDIKP